MQIEELLDHPVSFAFGGQNRGKVTNVEKTWRWLYNRFSDPVVTGETFEEYLALSDDERNRLKNVIGYWIGGTCIDGVRSRNTLGPRSCVMFDVDEADPKLFADLLAGRHPLAKLCYLIHTSRKHTLKKPRFRMIFPVGTLIPIEDYEATVRILASKLDPSMETVDHVSFRPAQMMYFPSISADMREQYRFHINPGTLLNWKGMLTKFTAEVGDWRDYEKLPRGASESNKRKTAEKAEDPREKKGMIGAFCRTYSVPDAIAEFLPEVYLESDDHSSKPRYTYVGGSGANGAVVEDDGLFLYSHHGTDPCGERLVNAFDMVRLHLYGAEDAGVVDDGDPRDLPSYGKMIQFCGTFPEVVRETARARYLDTAGSFSDLEGGEDPVPEPKELPRQAERPVAGKWYLQGTMPGEKTPFDRETDMTLEARREAREPDMGPTEEKAKEAGPDMGSTGKSDRDGWFDTLMFTPKGGIAAKVSNVVKIIQNDARLAGKFAYNELLLRTVIRQDIDWKNPALPNVTIHDRVNGESVVNWHDSTLRVALDMPGGAGSAGYGVKVAATDINAAVDIAGMQNRFHPVREYLAGLVWDETPRLHRVCQDFLGCSDTPYHREVFKLMALAAVARAHEPGHKFDTAMVLEGPQGIRKSTFLSVLGRKKWFAELKGDLGDQKAVVEQMAGHWIIELPEMAAWNRSEANDAKGFLSSVKDTVRLAYKPREETYLRQCVFFGTTNEEEYLRDLTGNRRIFPVRCMVPRIDTEAFDAICDQLWAEAVVLYRQARELLPRSVGDLALELSTEARDEAVAKQSAAVDEGVAGEWARDIEEWANTPLTLGRAKAARVGTSDVGFDDLDNPGARFRVTRISLKSAWIHALDRREDQFDGRTNLPLQNAFRILRATGRWEKGRDKNDRFIYRVGTDWDDVLAGFETISEPLDPDTGDLV